MLESRSDLVCSLGFATGLRRPTTLIIGDVSFLHDTNGLTLLKSGESLPPVTIVLINNGGGGIFSFLPIADSIERDTFNLLWATPQHANIEGIYCKAIAAICCCALCMVFFVSILAEVFIVMGVHQVFVGLMVSFISK